MNITQLEDEQNIIFQLLAAILHLGNLSFQKDVKNNDNSLIGNKDILEITAGLFEVLPNRLETSLCNRNMSARAKSVYVIPLKVFLNDLTLMNVDRGSNFE